MIFGGVPTMLRDLVLFAGLSDDALFRIAAIVTSPVA